MRKLLLPMVGLVMIAIIVGATPASAFTSYPNLTCPDTLSIVRLKTLLGSADPCAPVIGVANGAPGDTVLGVGGIITGFDEVPTGFDIYIQQSAGGPNSGIDVFTHGTNLRAPYGFNLGDSIVVEYARVANFSGDIEVESPNNNFSAPNIVLRKVNTGHALPAPFVGNTTDLTELLTNATFKPYVSALVKLTGPVRIARLVSTSGALVVRNDGGAPSDSVFIDFFKLQGNNSPALGTVINSITGIGNAAARGYRIMPRTSADVVDNQPPTLKDAYAVADNEYRVVFDRPVTSATAQNSANYSLGSFGTVSGAALDGTSAVTLTVTVQPHGSAESVTVSGVAGVANGIAIITPQASSFLAGVLSCGEMSAANPDSLLASPCRDLSRYLGSPAVGIGSGLTGQYSNGPFGPRSTVTGIVTGVYGNLYYMEDATPTLPANNHRGITVFAPPSALTLGHRYLLAGSDEEFYSENEFAGIQYVLDQGTPGVPSSIPLAVGVANLDTCDASQNINSARDYLSEVVTLQNVTVVQRFNPLPTSGFHVANQPVADTIFIENLNNVLGANSSSNPNYPAIGSVVTVTGVMHYTTNTSSPSFRVCPRTPADITTVAGVGSRTGQLSFSVYPNPAHTARFTFSLPQAEEVELSIYDVAGRKLATLFQGQHAAGTDSREWSGRAANGSPVGGGVFFARLKAGGVTRAIRTVYLGR